MKRMGRPKTRTDEASMFAIWRLVRMELAIHGAKNISQACRAVMRKADGLIKFKDPRLEESQQLVDLIDNPELLRQRYYEAERMRADPDLYPILSHRAAMLEADLPAMAERHAEQARIYDQMRKEGHHPDGSTLKKFAKN